MVIAYTSHQLRQLCQRATKSLMRVSREVYYNLKQFDICYASPTHTETTGGQCRLRAPKPIQPIVTTTRSSVVKQSGVNNANLITLTFTESRNGSTTARSCSDRSRTNAVTCLLLNIRYVCNKPVTVKEHMIDQKADLMFLTETWCKPNKTAVLNELPPPRPWLQLLWRLPFVEACRRCRIVIQDGI